MFAATVMLCIGLTTLLTCVSALRAGTVPDFTVTLLGEDPPISPPVATNFASFSYEVPCAPYMFSDKSYKENAPGPFTPKTSYANLLNVLRGASSSVPGYGLRNHEGPNIRIGGNSADETWFSQLPGFDPKKMNDTNTVNVRDIATYAFASTWNGTVTIDLNIRQQFNTTNSVEYAVAAVQLLNPKIIAGFEIGNEPDLFVQNKIRQKDKWFWSTYNAEFQRYADALQTTGNIPMPRIQGGTWACCYYEKMDGYITQWSTPGPVSSDKQNLLSSFSQHHYAMSAKSATVEKLLAPHAASSVFTENAKYATFSMSQRGVPFVIGEGNSCYDGGADGISNAFTSALWGIDTLCWAAHGNITRWNFHGCPTGSYTPIQLVFDAEMYAAPRPLFFGMWFFTRFTADKAQFVPLEKLTTARPGNNQNLAVWATKAASPEGKHLLRVAILQKTAAPNATQVSVLLKTGYSNVTGHVYRLQATTMEATELSNITWAGMSFDGVTSGIPKGTPSSESVSTNSAGELTVFVKAFSAALVEFELQS